MTGLFLPTWSKQSVTCTCSRSKNLQFWPDFFLFWGVQKLDIILRTIFIFRREVFLEGQRFFILRQPVLILGHKNFLWVGGQIIFVTFKVVACCRFQPVEEKEKHSRLLSLNDLAMYNSSIFHFCQSCPAALFQLALGSLLIALGMSDLLSPKLDTTYRTQSSSSNRI